VFTKTYMLNAAHGTEQGIGWGLYMNLAFRLGKTEEEDYACDLAGAITNYVLCKKPPNPRLEEFGQQNRARIEREAYALCGEHGMAELLSGAAYNICYGHYLRAGGGQLMNKFLGFIKADSRPGIADTGDLNKMSPQILELIFQLKQLSLWKPRGENPNEVVYFNAVKNFMEQQKARVPSKKA
jgi:hypothetical protein